MVKKILIISFVVMLLVASSTPALATKPADPNERGNAREERGNPKEPRTNSSSHGKGNPVSPLPVVPVSSVGTLNTPQLDKTTGFDEWGYNRSARIFNGTAWGWCMGKVGDPEWCESYLGDTKNDHLVMKWNAEWDRGNAEGWLLGPYRAYENNEWNGKVPGGSGDVWHYKIVWVGTCGGEGELLPNGGYCIWGQFEVLMDQGTSDGVHEWFAHAIPNGYGSYP